MDPSLALGHVQGDDESPERPERPHHGPRLRRTNSFSDWESLHNVWTAAEVIKAAGYPLEQHTVTTSDGYVLRMERLPREGTHLLDTRDTHRHKDSTICGRSFSQQRCRSTLTPLARKQAA